MFKFVHQTCLSAGLFAGCLTVLLAAPALAQTYDCNIRQRSWAGLISESYRFDVDAERDRVEVLDPIIRFARTKPVKGALEAVSPTEFRVTWGVRMCRLLRRVARPTQPLKRCLWRAKRWRYRCVRLGATKAMPVPARAVACAQSDAGVEIFKRLRGFPVLWG